MKVIKTKKYKVVWEGDKASLYKRTKLLRWEKIEEWSIEFMMASTLILETMEENEEIKFLL